MLSVWWFVKREFQRWISQVWIPAQARKLFGISGKRSRRCCLRPRKQTVLLLYKYSNQNRSPGKENNSTGACHSAVSRKVTLGDRTGCWRCVWASLRSRLTLAKLNGIWRVVAAIATPTGSRETLSRFSVSRPNVDHFPSDYQVLPFTHLIACIIILCLVTLEMSSSYFCSVAFC